MAACDDVSMREEGHLDGCGCRECLVGLFENACLAGNFLEATRFDHAFGIHKREIKMAGNESEEGLLFLICESWKCGKLIKWFIERFDFSKAEVMSENVLQWACVHEDLEVLKWVANRFQLSVEDIHANDEALLIACANGSDELSRWMAERFHISEGGAAAMY
jgi:hypothetical protein